jgi:uncharacterized protein with GYD domain
VARVTHHPADDGRRVIAHELGLHAIHAGFLQCHRPRTGRAMPTYLTFFTYTNAAWHEMVERPEDREGAARQVIESNGGKLISFYWMFGSHDGLAIYETSDAVVAAMVLVGIRASGRIEQMVTRLLLTGDEAQRVLDLAKFAATNYAPPGGRTDWHSDYDVLA